MPPTPAHDRYLADHADRHLAELHAFLRIPSVSALPAHRPHILAAADWLADRLRAIGVPRVELLPTGAGPVVVGHWPVPGQPTALLYGHYDVQPADPLDLWETPPFEPTVRDGRLFARGASDDKGALLAALNGIEALVKTDGAPPIGLTFFLEGEEEIGSPTLPALIHSERDRLACDVVISADGGMYAREIPSLTVATKGLTGCQIDLRTAGADLHSGQYGAAVPNAARSVAQLVAGLHDADGRVAVAGFYDRVRDLTPEERAEIAAVPFDEAAYLAGIGAPAAWGEPGFSPLERAFARPTLDVNGVWSGFQGEGAKTVTPAEAHAKLTCRLVPDQDPDEILALIERHVAARLPTGAAATVVRHPGAARPFAIRRDHPALRTAGDVLRDLYGREPLVIRLGGTLPVAEIFQRELGADMVFFAWEMPDAQLHAPNEFIALADFRLSARAYSAYLPAHGTKPATSPAPATRRLRLASYQEHPMPFATILTGDRPVRLAEIDTAANGGLTETEANDRLGSLAAELRELQELVYAAETHAVLVLLQGMDAAGKDVTIANVFAAANPQSCRVAAIKPRTDEEEAHDFLWRAHAPMPGRGELVILDRSYYEQVVADRVLGEVDAEQVRRRCGHVNAFERLLADDGKTIVLKFFLHVGHAEQGRRLEERQADPETAWKISANDWKARAAWDDYMAAYDAALNATATPDAPWYVVPSDRQWFHNLAVAEAIVDRLRPHRAGWLAARHARGEEKRAEAQEARGG